MRLYNYKSNWNQDPLGLHPGRSRCPLCSYWSIYKDLRWSGAGRWPFVGNHWIRTRLHIMESNDHSLWEVHVCDLQYHWKRLGRAYGQANFLMFSLQTSYFCIDCGETFNEDQGTFGSPDFPEDKYPSNIVCIWHINVTEGFRVLLDFTEFQVAFQISKYLC